jgi:hypothetical protein
VRVRVPHARENKRLRCHGLRAQMKRHAPEWSANRKLIDLGG